MNKISLAAEIVSDIVSAEECEARRFYPQTVRAANQQERENHMPDRKDMPVFVIKGKDALAIPTLNAYRKECMEHGLVAQEVEVAKAIEEIARWQARNIDLTKLPDHKHVPVNHHA